MLPYKGVWWEVIFFCPHRPLYRLRSRSIPLCLLIGSRRMCSFFHKKFFPSSSLVIPSTVSQCLLLSGYDFFKFTILWVLRYNYVYWGRIGRPFVVSFPVTLFTYHEEVWELYYFLFLSDSLSVWSPLIICTVDLHYTLEPSLFLMNTLLITLGLFYTVNQLSSHGYNCRINTVCMVPLLRPTVVVPFWRISCIYHWYGRNVEKVFGF